jgi:hypothetical protein
MTASVRHLSEIGSWSVSDSVETLRNEFSSKGLVFLEGLEKPEALLRALSPLGTVYHHRDSLASGLTHVATSEADAQSTAGDGKLGFTKDGLIPHTDRSGAKDPPNMLAFWIERPAAISGASLFVDGFALFEVMSCRYPDELAVLCRPNSAIFKSENGYLESSVFSTEGECLRIRFRFDKMIFLSPDAARAVEVMLPVIRELSLIKRLRAGDGYLIDNLRWLHGRTHFVGTRSAYRLLLSTGDEDTIKEAAIAVH